MKKTVFVVAGSLLLAAGMIVASTAAKEPSPGAKTSEPKSNPADAAQLAAIRESVQKFRDAFNRGDARAIAALWTKDGEYIDESGESFQGRDAIAKEYASFFAAHSGTKINLVVDSLRLIHEVAIENGRASISPAPAGAPGTSKYTVVHAKVDGKWLMAFARDTRVETPSAYRHLKDFEWLIGTWTAAEQGGFNQNAVEMKCSWGANKSTVEITYKIDEQGGLDPVSGKQIVAWDAATGQIRSWAFSSDGGRSVGIWTEHEGGWTVATEGVQPDGTKTSAVNSFTRFDENSLIWQSSQRAAGDAAVPDAEEVILQRAGGSQ